MTKWQVWKGGANALLFAAISIGLYAGMSYVFGIILWGIAESFVEIEPQPFSTIAAVIVWLWIFPPIFKSTLLPMMVETANRDDGGDGHE